MQNGNQDMAIVSSNNTKSNIEEYVKKWVMCDKQLKIEKEKTDRLREIKPLDQIKLIDPAQGSANFLLYAFDLFYDLYQDQIDNYGASYNIADIPKLIIEKNTNSLKKNSPEIQE
jgi:hypothetical protein